MEVLTLNDIRKYSHYEDNILIKPQIAIATQVYLMILIYVVVVGWVRRGLLSNMSFNLLFAVTQRN